MVSFPFLTAEADSWKKQTYNVTKILDGDTFDATDGNITFRVRVAGMDAPEKAQPYGKLATYQLSKLLEGRKVKIRSIGEGRDMYNRILGQVYVDEEDVSILMIQQGFAAYYRPRCRDFPEDKKHYDYDPRPYVEAEKRARAERLYLWSNEQTELPCEFRRRNR